MKISRDINGNKILKIAGSDLAVKTGFSIQTAGNLIYTDRNDLHDIETTKKEVFDYVTLCGSKKQIADLQVGQPFNIKDLRDQRLNKRPFFKIELSDQEVDQLVLMFGKGCQQRTKEALRIAFKRVECGRSHWSFERIMWTGKRWAYCAGQDYTAEFAQIRKFLIN